MTTEEAIEVGARAMFAEEQCDRLQKQDVAANWQGRLNDRDRDEYRRLSLAVLEAVETRIKAGAWDEGFEDGRNISGSVCQISNPYRRVDDELEQGQLRRIPTYANCATCDGGGCGDCT